MTYCLNSPGTNLLKVLWALAVSMFVAGATAAATPRIDESQLLDLGFKVLVATTTVHPESQKGAEDADNRAYRLKQDDVMRKATARDLSNPFLGASWADLGW